MIAAKRGMLAMQNWELLRIVAEALISLTGAITVVIGVVKVIPMIFNGTMLIARLQSAESAAREYRLACNEQHRTITLLESRNAQLRHENDQQVRDAMDFAVTAGTYIIALVGSLQTLTTRLQQAGVTDVPPLPPVPNGLQIAVEMARRKLSEKRASDYDPEPVAPV